MVRLTGTLSRLGSQKILVVGDLMLDTYTIGKAKRISPEAPVAVVNVLREENRPGGAGNVVLNLLSLGAQVAVIGRIGSDAAGHILKEALLSEQADIQGIFEQEGFLTPTKNRIIAENQQIVRVDYEQALPLPEMLEQRIIEGLPQLLKGVSAVAISDYGKGFLTKTLLNAVIDAAKERNVPVITDPKGIDFTKYRGTTVIKPNLSEAYAAAGLMPEASLDLAAHKILQLANADILMITRSEEGISIFHRCGTRHDFPVRVREIKDVTGAGDTVLAMLTCALANGLDISDAAELSNVAAGIAIERFGCARVSLADLARRLLDTDVENKVFDDDHLFALQEALKGKSYKILGLNGKEEMTPSVFSAINKLAKGCSDEIVVFLQDSHPESEFVNLLASIHDIKFIILQGNNLKSLCEAVPPAETFALVGKELVALSSPSELFSFKE